MKLDYDKWKAVAHKDWKTEPISPVCQCRIGIGNSICGKPTDAAYPCMGSGWMALCLLHNQKHAAFPIEELIAKGERFE